jgi:hypothetical protein
LAGDYLTLLLFLGVPRSKIDAIEQTHPARGDVWLSKGLYEWLRRNYNTDKYGLPSWRTLIKSVGYIDFDLARGLAKEHEGNLILC